jgi:ribonucleotide monophosphatase NagD (HAD superfamily)
MYLTNLSFMNEEEINSFSDKQKPRTFVTSRTALKEMLREGSKPKRCWIKT